MQLKYKKLMDGAQAPTYATEGSACFDLYACFPEDRRHAVELSERVPAWTFDTGLAFEIPPGFAMFIFSRSGHGFGYDTRLANCVGVIDSDYRGDVRVRLTYDGRDTPLWVEHGDRIAQGVVWPVQQCAFREVMELSDTKRGVGGFGSTGR